jgi:isoquinoline 1-oxidoreductase
MLFARILRPPSHGATLVSADTTAAKKLEGVTVIEDKDLIAVLHEDIEKADAALKTIKTEYSLTKRSGTIRSSSPTC